MTDNKRLLEQGPSGTACPACGSHNIAHNTWCRIHLITENEANRSLIWNLIDASMRESRQSKREQNKS